MFEQASGAARHSRWQVWRLLLPRRKLHRRSCQRRESMAKPVPRAERTETGGSKVMLSSTPSYPASPVAPTLPGNPIPALKKKRSRFTCIDLLFCVRELMVRGHGFLREEILAIGTMLDRVSQRRSTKEDTCSDRSKNGRAVTTSHLFWPNQRRKGASSLRNWQPKSESLPTKATRRKLGGGPGEVNQTQPAKPLYRSCGSENLLQRAAAQTP